jgi:hypothetical protein
MVRMWVRSVRTWLRASLGWFVCRHGIGRAVLFVVRDHYGILFLGVSGFSGGFGIFRLLGLFASRLATAMSTSAVASAPVTEATSEAERTSVASSSDEFEVRTSPSECRMAWTPSRSRTGKVNSSTGSPIRVQAVDEVPERHRGVVRVAVGRRLVPMI